METQEFGRPNPDEILAGLKYEEELSKRGKLKVFFGMCAGVGKTFSMLKAAQIEKAKGTDIIIGIVETHKRIETEALLEGFEILPRKQIEYKGTLLEEMDLDGLISRNPQIALVDELAHSNAPGSRHLKRYQDIIELLENGINVYTTVNVQHLESRTDIISQITGIIVRESVPDEIFERADEIELIDITPDELIERFSEGKVYTPDKSVQAIQNFFRKGNITALREMALRIVADRVDKQLRSYMQQKRIPGPWKSGLHLMVAIGPSPQSAKLVRWAKNLSYTMGARLIALYVETSKPLKNQETEQLNKNIKLAKQLGAEVIFTSGDDIVKAILSIAHKENITHIVIGKPRKRTIIPLLEFGNMVQKLIRHSGNIDVYVLGSDIRSDFSYLKYISNPSFTSGFRQYISSALAVVLSSVICFLFYDYIGYQSVSFILLFVVSILATIFGIGPILLAATLSALIWDYFFIPPQFTLHIGKPEDVLMFGMFFFIALVNGVLTSRVRRQEKLARDREERANALYRLTKKISDASNINELIHTAQIEIHRYFSVDVYFLLNDGNNQLIVYDHQHKNTRFSGSELSVANWTFKHSMRAGKFTDTLPSGNYTYYPMPGTNLKPGVIAVEMKVPVRADLVEFWDTFITQISSAIERSFLNDLANKAHLLNESDKLYKTLFNSISHELRIPVATIMGASDNLLSDKLNLDTKGVLVQEINKASQRLNRLIENLLNMSRLESGRIMPRLDWCDIHDLIHKVNLDLKEELSNFKYHVVISEAIPFVKLDFGLMEQVLYNLIFNAITYSPQGTTIRVKAYYDSGNIVFEVMDRGLGFPEESIPLLFNKFYRIEGSKTGGTGLGLSIVKGFVEAHNGTIIAQNRKNGGALLIVKIPSDLPNFDQLNQ